VRTKTRSEATIIIASSLRSSSVAQRTVIALIANSLYNQQQVFYEHVLPYADSRDLLPLSKQCLKFHKNSLRCDANAFLKFVAAEVYGLREEFGQKEHRFDAIVENHILPLRLHGWFAKIDYPLQSDYDGLISRDVETWMPVSSSGNKRIVVKNQRISEIAVRSVDLYLEENIFELLSPLTNLEVLSLFKNNMKFDIGSFKPTFPMFRKIWLNGNKLTGEYPTFEGCPALEDLYVASE